MSAIDERYAPARELAEARALIESGEYEHAFDVLARAGERARLRADADALGEIRRLEARVWRSRRAPAGSVERPTGPVVGVVHLALGALGFVLTLVWVPALFGIDLDWRDVITTAFESVTCPSAQPAAGDYLRMFLFAGGVSWLVVALALAVLMSRDAPRRRASLAVSTGWFASIVLASVITAAVIGPLPTITCF